MIGSGYFDTQYYYFLLLLCALFNHLYRFFLVVILTKIYAIVLVVHTNVRLAI